MKMNMTKVEAYEKQFEKGTIIDGVIDKEQYFKSKPRLAWFLKEPYSNEKQGFHIKTHYAQPNAYDNFFRNIATHTWHPIIYTSYGILNEYIIREDMSSIREQPDMCDVIKSIAIINANKFPSKTGTYTTDKNLREGFIKFKKLIQTQIDVLKPEIYIFCGTFHLYQDMFGLTYENKSDEYWIRDMDGKLFLEVYHPANRQQKKADYVNEIVGAVENWSNQKEKELKNR